MPVNLANNKQSTLPFDVENMLIESEIARRHPVQKTVPEQIMDILSIFSVPSAEATQIQSPIIPPTILPTPMPILPETDFIDPAPQLPELDLITRPIEPIDPNFIEPGLTEEQEGLMSGVITERPESGFFTKTEKAVQNFPKIMTAEQARNMIAKQGKKDDIDQPLINNFLTGKPSGKITRDELLNFVKEHQTKVETTVKVRGHTRASMGIDENPDGTNTLLNRDTGEVIFTGTPEEVSAKVPEVSEQTKYSQYQLPGGENYQETLFRLPTKGFAGQGGVPKNLLEESQGFPEEGNFTSHAYDEPNTFGWMRTNDRTTANGENVLFIEEAQKVNSRSDNITEEQLRALPQFARNGYTEFAVKQMIERAVKEGKDVVAWTTGEQQVDRYKESITQNIDSVQWDQPYVDDELFTPGGKDVKIELPSGQIVSLFIAKDGEILDSSGHLGRLGDEVVGKNINQVIGKGMGNQILNQNEGRIAGEGLTIGGEDLRTFYDRNLPSVADKYIKKLDPGAKVEEFEMGLTPDLVESQNLEERVQRIANDLFQEDYNNLLPANQVEVNNIAQEELRKEPSPKQPGFRITPKMREKVLKEGQPLSFNIQDGTFPDIDAGTLTA